MIHSLVGIVTCRYRQWGFIPRTYRMGFMVHSDRPFAASGSWSGTVQCGHDSIWRIPLACAIESNHGVITVSSRWLRAELRLVAGTYLGKADIQVPEATAAGTFAGRVVVEETAAPPATG